MTTIQAHATNYTKGRTKTIDRIVVHYTAGDGDTAEGNGRYFAGANRKASAHYFVDENSVVQSVSDSDTAWHAGNWAMNCRSIGVEMCSKKDKNGIYYIPAKTVNNAQYLIKCLMKAYGVPLSGIIRHYDVTGKKCPAPMVDETAWNAFKAGLVETTEQQTAVVTVTTAASWAQEAWAKATTAGIMDGTRPQDPVTRQELAVVLERLRLV